MLVAKNQTGQGCPTSGMGAGKSIFPFPKIRVNNWPKKKFKENCELWHVTLQ
jgi:hypothetical protein